MIWRSEPLQGWVLGTVATFRLAGIASVHLALSDNWHHVLIGAVFHLVALAAATAFMKPHWLFPFVLPAPEALGGDGQQLRPAIRRSRSRSQSHSQRPRSLAGRALSSLGRSTVHPTPKGAPSEGDNEPGGGGDAPGGGGDAPGAPSKPPRPPEGGAGAGLLVITRQANGAPVGGVIGEERGVKTLFTRLKVVVLCLILFVASLMIQPLGRTLFGLIQDVVAISTIWTLALLRVLSLLSVRSHSDMLTRTSRALARRGAPRGARGAPGPGDPAREAGAGPRGSAELVAAGLGLPGTPGAARRRKGCATPFVARSVAGSGSSSGAGSGAGSEPGGGARGGLCGAGSGEYSGRDATSLEVGSLGQTLGSDLWGSGSGRAVPLGAVGGLALPREEVDEGEDNSMRVRLGAAAAGARGREGPASPGSSQDLSGLGSLLGDG